jgi:dipeptidyl aminopeptidase/acylaminoacyl peptidase
VLVRTRLSAGLAGLALAVLLPASAGAATAGLNGRIAFDKTVPKAESTFENGVWSVNPDGSAPMQLAGGEKGAYDGTYSPDGSRLVFSRYDELWTAAADGSGAHVLSPGNDHEKELNRWVQNYKDPETGQVVAWAKIHEEREERDAYSEASFSPDGAALAVTHYIGTYVVQTVCSTTGKQVEGCTGSYSGFRVFCEKCGASIDLIDSTTAAPLATVVPRSTTVFFSRPAYSASGAIAFEATPEGEFQNRQIRIVPAAGGTPAVLAGGELAEPDFSPDGTKVAFAYGRHEIGIVPSAGGAPTYIAVPQPEADTKAYSVRSPIWSPDGTLIAIGDIGAAGGGGLERYTQGGVYTMHADGSGLVRVQGEATVPTGWQSLPKPSPLRAQLLKGRKKVRLNRKGVAVVGKVVCGSSTCALTASKAKLKLGKKRYGVRALVAKSLAAGASGLVKVKVKGRALAALKARHGGKLILTLTAADIGGPQSVGFSPKLLPPAKKGKHRKHP